MKLSQVVDPRFKSAFNRLSAQSLPLRLAFKLRGIAANIAKQSEEFEAVRLAALNKFGMHDAEGKLKVNERNEVELSPEARQEFAVELQALGETEVEIGKISLAEFEDRAELSAEEVAFLGDLLVE
jgi:predicted DNA-binding protein (UPF0251 family)